MALTRFDIEDVISDVHCANFHSILITFHDCVRASMASSSNDSSLLSVKLKQRSVIEFLTAENVSPTEIHRRLQGVYGEQTVDRSTVNRWAIKFRDCQPGLGKIVDEQRSGRPVTATDESNRNPVDELIQRDRRISQKRISTILGISKERVGFIIGSLGYRKVCSRWVPLEVLTPENKQKRLECCKLLRDCYWEDGDDFLLNIVTGDESWVHHFDPEDKRQSMEYRRPSSPRQKKIRQENSKLCHQPGKFF